jgi:hypothetical protein
MTWESPMGWIKDNPAEKTKPSKGLVLSEVETTAAVEKVKKAQSLGYKVFFYDPNPGIEPLFLPYSYREREGGKKLSGCLENSSNSLTEAAISGVFDGMIRISWDDTGLHNQEWILCFLTAAEFPWNGHAPTLKEFKETFFKNYYGPGSVKIDELFFLFNESAYYYFDTFERKVWNFGDVGKTYLHDLPKGDALEYDPFWTNQYKDIITRSRQELQKMDNALAIIEINKESGVKHLYDFEIFESIARLVRHTSQTYIDILNLEYAIGEANRLTFINRDSAYHSLNNATKIIESNLKERAVVFTDLVNTWEKTRFPKGMSTKGKKYFYQQDRTRHFANRRSDMTFLIYDEQKLDVEGYLEKLKAYMEKYKNSSL